MICSFRRVVNALAIVLLMYVVVSVAVGAIASYEARALCIVLSIVCALCCVGLYLDMAPVRTFTGSLFIIIALSLVPVALRTPKPNFFFSGVFIAVGIALIVGNRKKIKDQTKRKRGGL